MTPSAGPSTVLCGAVGLMGSSAVVVRLRHLVTVMRLRPWRWARVPVVSFDAWSPARTRGVVWTLPWRLPTRALPPPLA